MTRNWNNSTTSSQAGGQSNPRGTNESKTTPSDQSGYNIDNDTREEEGAMPTDTLQELGDNVQLHDAEPIMERKSDLFGMVRVYPPSADPKEWADHSWLLTTEHDEEKNPPGLSVRLKAKYVKECFERPYFINDFHRFGTDDHEQVKIMEEKWDIEIPDRNVKPKDFTFDD